MNRPEDIPQIVWDRAVFVFSTAPAAQGHYETIARAILAAEQRERTACAKVASAHSECERDCGDMIAAAIRNRNGE